jgi:hypothetical protein
MKGQEFNLIYPYLIFNLKDSLLVNDSNYELRNFDYRYKTNHKTNHKT